MSYQCRAPNNLDQSPKEEQSWVSRNSDKRDGKVRRLDFERLVRLKLYNARFLFVDSKRYSEVTPTFRDVWRPSELCLQPTCRVSCEASVHTHHICRNPVLIFRIWLARNILCCPEDLRNIAAVVRTGSFV